MQGAQPIGRVSVSTSIVEPASRLGSHWNFPPRPPSGTITPRLNHLERCYARTPSARAALRDDGLAADLGLTATLEVIRSMRVEDLSGVERPCRWSDGEKAQIIEEILVQRARPAELA